MSPDRPKTPAEKQDPGPEESMDPAPKNTKDAGDPGKKSPLFRMARLDGRDTLKYEDTADK